MSIRLRIALVAVLSVVLAANAAATLYAAATAPVIKACVAKSGVMRYVPSGKCASGEKALQWNVQGPVGPTGPAGAAGTGGTVQSQPPAVWVKAIGATGSAIKVPAGSYRVTVWERLAGYKVPPGFENVAVMKCGVSSGPGNGDGYDASKVAWDPWYYIPSGISFSAATYVSLAEAGGITVVCKGDVGQMTVEPIDLVVLQPGDYTP